jgi:nucleoside-diphosphate-sugar epimerase
VIPDVIVSPHSEIPAQHVDCSKAKRLCAWEPRYHFRSALAETATWYQQYFSVAQRRLSTAA